MTEHEHAASDDGAKAVADEQASRSSKTAEPALMGNDAPVDHEAGQQTPPEIDSREPEAPAAEAGSAACAPADAPGESAADAAAAEPDKKSDPRALLALLRDASISFREARPLALRIDQEVSRRFDDHSRRCVRSALRMHTASTRYLKSLALGEVRFDFDGNPAGEVTAEQREHANQMLSERFVRRPPAQKPGSASGRAAAGISSETGDDGAVEARPRGRRRSGRGTAAVGESPASGSVSPSGRRNGRSGRGADGERKRGDGVAARPRQHRGSDGSMAGKRPEHGGNDGTVGRPAQRRTVVAPREQVAPELDRDAKLNLLMQKFNRQKD